MSPKVKVVKIEYHIIDEDIGMQSKFPFTIGRNDEFPYTITKVKITKESGKVVELEGNSPFGFESKGKSHEYYGLHDFLYQVVEPAVNYNLFDLSFDMPNTGEKLKKIEKYELQCKIQEEKKKQRWEREQKQDKEFIEKGRREYKMLQKKKQEMAERVETELY